MFLIYKFKQNRKNDVEVVLLVLLVRLLEVDVRLYADDTQMYRLLYSDSTEDKMELFWSH